MTDPPPRAISEIFDAFYGKVRAYAAKLIGPEEADDIASEVFVKVARSLGTLADGAKLTPWIYAITLNTVRDAARSRASRPPPAAGRPAPARGASEVPSPTDEIADTRSCSPEETQIRREMIDCFLRYVKQLPPNYYDVYVLSEFEDLSNEEIARRLGLSAGTVKIRLHRARVRLYDEVRRHCRCYYNERGELLGEPRKAE